MDNGTPSSDGGDGCVVNRMMNGKKKKMEMVDCEAAAAGEFQALTVEGLAGVPPEPLVVVQLYPQNCIGSGWTLESIESIRCQGFPMDPPLLIVAAPPARGPRGSRSPKIVPGVKLLHRLSNSC